VMAGPAEGDGPLTPLVEAVYDTVLELTTDDEEGRAAQHRFFRELTRVEVAMLRERSDSEMPTFRHPVQAMKSYRAFMCDAGVYDEIGNAKIRMERPDLIEIRFWQCRYAGICATRERRLCLRTHSLTEAAELMSPTTFKRIERLEFSPEGNCVVDVSVEFKGDHRLEPEERVGVRHLCSHLTREEADEFFVCAFLVGSEYAANHTPEVDRAQTLTGLALRLKRSGVHKGPLGEHKVVRTALKAWKMGNNAFVHD
jgi:hypothetical protein